MKEFMINIAYLISASLFIFGLRNLSHPKTAVRGNMIGALGMLVAVVVTLLDNRIVDFSLIILGLLVGAVVGTVLALRVQMTAMPQLVAVFNGLGGGASALVAGTALYELLSLGMTPDVPFTTATVASGIIGAVTFFGSGVAFGKLQGLIKERPIRYSGEQVVKALVFGLALLFGLLLIKNPGDTHLYWLMILVSSVLGVLLTIAIGGADMPVVIALLNSYSGLAAAATGFVLENNALIISGSLVGASGIILTNLMCKAMNRSLLNVLFGGFGEAVSEEEDIYQGKVKATTPEEVALILEGARRVVIVPGYGMAVAQAQYAVRDLYNLLESRGVEVEFGIHPVAGRMPGHMNVLLAEVDIPYEKMKELEEINPTFDQTDVVIVIGANDVVNPSAQTDPKSPIAGMPVLEVWKARTVVVIKRSLSPGFAGIPNPLFAMENTLMLFMDAKKAVQEIVNALKES
ncbi:MAG: NAD(P)(+) transhydrogenase (Re/Si-specific) subunit beta [Aquificota bacterium]|nr:NAD(P)(+) transhydrogenase (Re/Si-specific) subunit beta [Aquificota bacterium]